MARSTSASESAASTSFAELASDLAAACADAIEHDRLHEVPDDSLGQVLAIALRVLAAKAQAG